MSYVGNGNCWYLVRVTYTYLKLRRVKSLLTHKRDQALHTLGDVCLEFKREVARALVEWLHTTFQDGREIETACQLLGF